MNYISSLQKYRYILIILNHNSLFKFAVTFYGNVKMYVKFRSMVQKAVYVFKFGDTAGYECVSNVPIMLHAIPFNLSSKESKKNCPVKCFY